MGRLFSMTGLLPALAALAFFACKASDDTSHAHSSGDADTDTDTTGDASVQDTDTDTSTDSETESETGTGEATNDCPGEVQSFIWIANTAEGTLSKICTITGVEVARYVTSPQGAGGDPSRTSVNLHGDAVVTNRNPTSGASSVTKFAADISDCVDKNGNDSIETSNGPTNVLPWGEDECMLWSQPIGGALAVGARATAWDGTENPKTGEGGNVYIGTVPGVGGKVFKLDGETGKVVASNALPFGAYGGAMDGKGGFWIVDFMCTTTSGFGTCQIGRVDMETLETKVFTVRSGYGIAVDDKGRIWTSGLNAVSRFDPETQERKVLNTAGRFNRGIAVDGRGGVWVAQTVGAILHVNEEDVTLIERTVTGASDTVGVAVDSQGAVWAVAQSNNSAYKLDPTSYSYEQVVIGAGPYTYSDMTGMQLRTVTGAVKK